MLGPKTRKFVSMIAAWILILDMVGCAPIEITPTQKVTPTKELTPYWTPSPSLELKTVTPVLELSTPALTPTPTPITYKIVKGDTMLGVALRFGITLEQLQSANADVDPRLLPVDTILIIPLGESLPEAMPTPTPLSVQLSRIQCYPSSDGGRWCVILIRNNHRRSIENLSAQVTLFSQDGKVLNEGVAIAPLNRLREGEAIPLSIFFPGPFEEEVIAQAHLLTSLPVNREVDRYLNLSVDDEHVEIATSGGQATIQGMLSLAKKSQPANQIWLAVMAYDAQGELVGLRKWEAANNLEPGKSMPFEIDVFSIGPAIDRVEVLAEARP